MLSLTRMVSPGFTLHVGPGTTPLYVLALIVLPSTDTLLMRRSSVSVSNRFVDVLNAGWGISPPKTELLVNINSETTRANEREIVRHICICSGKRIR